MKKIQLIGLALFAVFAFSAFAASSAFALESTWLVDGETLTVAHNVDSESTAAGFSLADAKGGIFGEEVEVLCTGTDLGTVAPGKADTLSSITVTGCTVMKGICGTPVTVEPINLPWNTSVVLIGSKFYDDTTTTVGNKKVGYKVVCNGFIEDTCEAALAQPELANGAGGVVEAIFKSADANQPKANCSRGGAGTGLVNGTDLILSEEGLTLAVSEG
jgi:hypothetical protein